MSNDLPSFLECYKTIILGVSFLGSTHVRYLPGKRQNATKEQDRTNFNFRSTPPNSKINKIISNLIYNDEKLPREFDQEHENPKPYLDLKTTKRYIVTKLFSFLHLIYFFVQMVITIQSCNEYTEKDPLCPEIKGVRIIALSCYLAQLIHAFIVYAWAHAFGPRICTFLNKLDQLDSVIFKGDPEGQQFYIRFHHRRAKVVHIYLPTVIIISLVLITLNHLHHPQFPGHITSLFLRPGDGFFSNWRNGLITLFSFGVQNFLILYFYLALYQFLFFTTITAVSFQLCLNALIGKSSPEKLLALLKDGDCGSERLLSFVESTVDKYEHIRSLMTEYNGTLSKMLLFFKGMFLVHMTLMSYFPLQKEKLLPRGSTTILVVVVIHYVVKVTELLSRMGAVYKTSKQFREVWMTNLRKVNFGEFRDTGRNQGQIENGKGSQRRGIVNIVKMKLILDTCTPFGFDVGGCYVVKPGTILTFFSIITSYLIIMLQLQI